jgi:hypothetical protein
MSDELIRFEDEFETHTLVPVPPPDSSLAFRKAVAVVLSGELLCNAACFAGFGWLLTSAATGLLALTMLILGVRRWKSESKPGRRSPKVNIPLLVNKNLSLLLSGCLLSLAPLMVLEGTTVGGFLCFFGALVSFICGLRRWKSESFVALPIAENMDTQLMEMGVELVITEDGDRPQNLPTVPERKSWLREHYGDSLLAGAFAFGLFYGLHPVAWAVLITITAYEALFTRD